MPSSRTFVAMWRSTGLFVSFILFICACGPHAPKPVASLPSGSSVEQPFMGCGVFNPKGHYQHDDNAIRAELSNIEQLTADLMTQLRDLDTPAADVNAEGLEQDRWFTGRVNYCTEACRNASPGEKELAYLQCLKWAATCRLETLLSRYDSLARDTLRH